ncbi:hypothetical protein OUZ56_019138 [Daphnia magna]|uniref:Uncharacterized protein n=1 Tax=Daphnia magna TaxID=35525 RepID=A0ABQ9ZAR4_9CRUS|nr:hypothetical protein OUZ56_019138 [Daphnia magna]
MAASLFTTRKTRKFSLFCSSLSTSAGVTVLYSPSLSTTNNQSFEDVSALGIQHTNDVDSSVDSFPNTDDSGNVFPSSALASANTLTTVIVVYFLAASNVDHLITDSPSTPMLSSDQQASRFGNDVSTKNSIINRTEFV